MSVWLYDSDSLDKNWNNLKEAIDFMQKWNRKGSKGDDLGGRVEWES